MEKIPVSVGILTFNSGKTLRRALESVAACDDIILCDGGSTDDTLALGAEFGVRVIAQDAQFKNPDGTLKNYSGVRNQCLDAAKNAWFLYIDADEAASPELVREVGELAARNDQMPAYRIPERFVIDGERIDYASNYPGYQYRVLRTDRGTRFVKPVHEQPPRFTEVFDVEAATLSGEWYVYWEQEDIRNYKARNYKYIAIEAARAKNMTVRTFLTKFIWHALRPILGVSYRTLRDRLLHPRGAHMPLSVEWGRVRYHGALIGAIGKQVLFAGKTRFVVPVQATPALPEIGPAFTPMLTQGTHFLEGNLHCAKHHVEHTGSNTYLLDFYTALGEVEKGKELVKYLLTKIVKDGEASVFYPGRLNQMNMANNIIDSGSCVDAIARFVRLHGVHYSAEERHAVEEALRLVVDSYLASASSAAQGKPITNQRLWGLTGIASFAALMGTHEYDLLITQSIERAFADMTVDGFFRYYPDAPTHGAFAGYDGITTFYQSRCIAFIRYALETAGVDTTPYQEPLARATSALLAMYRADGVKDLRLECKRWYWLNDYEVASHAFDAYAFSGGTAPEAASATHNALYQIRQHFRDGHLHADGDSALDFQCPIFWTAHLAWLIRTPRAQEQFDAVEALVPFSYRFLGTEVITDTRPGKRFLFNARTTLRNPTVGIYTNGLSDRRAWWELQAPKLPPSYAFSARENANHVWYALRGRNFREAIIRTYRFVRESLLMLLPRYAARYGALHGLTYTTGDGGRVSVSGTVVPTTKYGTIGRHRIPFSYTL